MSRAPFGFAFFFAFLVYPELLHPPGEENLSCTIASLSPGSPMGWINLPRHPPTFTPPRKGQSAVRVLIEGGSRLMSWPLVAMGNEATVSIQARVCTVSLPSGAGQTPCRSGSVHARVQPVISQRLTVASRIAWHLMRRRFQGRRGLLPSPWSGLGRYGTVLSM